MAQSNKQASSSENGPLMFQNEKEVFSFFQKDPETNKVVIFKGIVYDVKDYMEGHPGGSQLIKPYLGKDIQEPFEDQEHTKSALKILLQLPQIGKLIQKIDSSVPQSSSSKSTTDSKNEKQDDNIVNQKGGELKGYKFDYTQGIIKQIYSCDWSYEQYCEFINEPKELVNPVRDVIMFDSPFMEVFSKTQWWVIPIAWSVPFTYFLYLTLNNQKSFITNMVCFLFGIAFWTLGENVGHRFLFHGEDYWMKYVPNNKEIRTFHFLIHGIHHAFPMDRYRLVFPPLPGFILMYIFFGTPVRTLFYYDYQHPVSCGVIVGYLIYDLMHYFIHHMSMSQGSYLHEMKQYHLQHHYRNGTVGFGISMKLWDYVFGTELIVKTQKTK